MSELDASYAVCQQLARQSASNFYFSFLLLPREKRRAMCALYAYLRQVDDLGDDGPCEDGHRDADQRKSVLNDLRLKLDDALKGKSTDPILRALADTTARYEIPHEYLTAVLDGVEMDLDGRRYQTFTDLEQYCDRVAGVVGLACIHIWGFRGPAALELARRCGLAFQLTNILRDLKEDAQRGRIYLPAEDLSRFGYTDSDLERGQANVCFISLMQFEIARAEQFYVSAAELEPLLKRDGRRVFRVMVATYRALLEKIKRQPADVFHRRIRLSRWEKLRIASGALFSRSKAVRSASALETVSP